MEYVNLEILCSCKFVIIIVLNIFILQSDFSFWAQNRDKALILRSVLKDINLFFLIFILLFKLKIYAFIKDC